MSQGKHLESFSLFQFLLLKCKGKLSEGKRQSGRSALSHRSPYLGLLLLSGIDDGGTTDFSNLAALPVKGPAADFVPNDILYE